MIVVYAKFKVSEENAPKYIQAAAEMVAITRKESGCVSYELIRNKKEPDEFAFLEKWADEASLNAHLNNEQLKPIGQKLAELKSEQTTLSLHDIVI